MVPKAIDMWYHQTGEANHTNLYSQWRKFLPECNSKHFSQDFTLK